MIVNLILTQLLSAIALSQAFLLPTHVLFLEVSSITKPYQQHNTAASPLFMKL
jgi:hypothetical protein